MIHMAPYVDCIDKGVSSIMISYSSWNGVKLHGHHYLINDILKEKLGFKVDFLEIDRFSIAEIVKFLC
jgi:beta-glucosidase